MKLQLQILVAIFLFFVSSQLFAGENSKIQEAAKMLSKIADECLLDVRDKNINYYESINCKSLGKYHLNYLNAGGHEKNTPLELELLVAQAISTAWSALAVSESGNPGIRIW